MSRGVSNRKPVTSETADSDALASLPGIGRSTAAAIAALAFGARTAILDGNVKRVLARHRGVAGYPGAPKVEGALWTVANKIEPWEPQSTSVPVLWRYGDLRDHVLRSVELVSPEKAGRRVIYLNNPGRRDVSAAVGSFS